MSPELVGAAPPGWRMPFGTWRTRRAARNSALVRYEEGSLTELVGFSDWLQVVQRIR